MDTATQLYEYTKQLQRTLGEFEPITVEPYLPIFIELCLHLKMCPSCGKQKVSKYSKANKCCENCKGRISGIKSKHKCSVDVAYAKIWMSNKSNKYSFYLLFKEVKKRIDNDKLSLLTLLGHYNIRLEWFQSQTGSYLDQGQIVDVNGPIHQINIDECKRKIKEICKKLNLQESSVKAAQTLPSTPRKNDFFKLMAHAATALKASIDPVEEIRHLISRRKCPICGVDLPTNRRSEICKACQNKFNIFKSRNKNIKNTLELYKMYHSIGKKHMDNFVRIIKEAKSLKISPKERQKELENEWNALEQGELKDLYTQLTSIQIKINTILERRDQIFSEWKRLETEVLTSEKH